MQLSAAAAPDALKKYHSETENLQIQLIDKQALLQKEWLKDDPNLDTVGTIQKSIIDIEMEMQKVAKKLGMKNCFGSCGMMMGNGCGGGMGGMRGCGK